MKRLAAAAGVLLFVLMSATAAGAAPNTATTVPATGSSPVSGDTFYVVFTVFGTTPVVPYEYALQNTCTYPPKTYGNYTLGQHDDIVTWTDHDSNGNPMVTMPIYLQSVPTGSKCVVTLVKKNTVVKGSTYSYTVG